MGRQNNNNNNNDNSNDDDKPRILYCVNYVVIQSELTIEQVIIW